MQEALAEEQRLAARYVNDIEIAKAQRDFELKKAAYDQEVQTKKAQSDLAYSLQVIAAVVWSLGFGIASRNSISEYLGHSCESKFFPVNV